MEWLSNIQALGTVEPPPPKIEESKPENNIQIKNTEPKSKKIYKIEKAMATLTMAQVLKSQRHYNEALAVLDVLESNSENNSDIAQKKKEILELITASQK